MLRTNRFAKKVLLKNIQPNKCAKALPTLIQKRSFGYGDRFGSDRGDRYGGERSNYDRPNRDDRNQRGGFGSRQRDSFNTGGQGSYADFGGAGVPDWSQETLTPVNQESADVENLSTEDVEAFRKEHDIRVTCPEIKHVLSMEDTGFPNQIRQVLENGNFTKPTPIQAQSWPIVMSGKNLVGIAQTGSGKTLGFMLPLLSHVKAQTSSGPRQPKALVIAPTRELCNQIYEASLPYCRALGITSFPIYGGAGKYPQINAARRGLDVVIATPGRLIDLLNEGSITLRDVSYTVLDEADRCLDMGFEPQIRKLFEYARPDKQLLMFSATWPKDVHTLANDFMQPKYEKLTIGSLELSANKSITQEVVVTSDDREKLGHMVEKIEETKGGVLIFCQSKKRVDMLENTLRTNGIKCAGIHGDKTQRDRERTLRSLRDKSVKVVVATDVAARGIDVDDINLVVNCDLPQNIDSYIHRIGRTGRQSAKGQNKGVALSFYNERIDSGLAKDLVKVMKEADQGSNIPEQLARSAERGSYGGGGFNFGNRRGGGRQGGGSRGQYNSRY